MVIKNGHGLGVSNVHNRIVMFADDRYGLHYKTNQIGGVTVTVSIPVIYDENITPNH